MFGYVLLLYFALAGSAWAGLVGSYDNARNLPGNIDPDASFNVVYDHRVPDKILSTFEHRTSSHILYEDYFKADGSISIDAISKKISEIKRHESVAFLTYCVRKLPDEAQGHANYCRSVINNKIMKKWRARKISIIYRFAVEQLQKAQRLAPTVHRDTINQPTSQQFLAHLFQGLEVFSSIQDHDPFLPYVKGNVLKSLRALRNASIRTGLEATNLVIPANMKEKHPKLRASTFFTPAQLLKYDVDVSQLDPVDSGFWRKQASVRAFDTSNYNNQTGYSAEMSDSEKEPSVTYKFGESFSGGATPKMKVLYQGKKWKLKYETENADITKATTFASIIQRWTHSGKEVHVETVVNNLASALGFTVIPTFYKRSVRLYLPQKDPTDEEEFDRLYQKMLREQSVWDEDRVPYIHLSDVQQDEEGRFFVRIQSTSLEKSSDTEDVMKVGLFNKSSYSRNYKREYRAFNIFLVWISDYDTKDDNTNMLLIPDGKDSYNVAYTFSDMGYALGSAFGRDAPNFLNRDIIDYALRNTDGSLRSVFFSHNMIFPSMFEKVTINDAKWIIRLMAQLSPDQIRKAFRGAGYNDLLTEYFTQIMLRRRDKLASVFGLLGETVVDQQGNHIVIREESEITDDNKSTYAVKGYEKYFRNGYLYSPKDKITNNPRSMVEAHYDRAFRNINPGTFQHKLWQAIKSEMKVTLISSLTNSLSNLSISNRTFGLPLLDGNFCESACFYDGLRVGLTNFLPNRFVIRDDEDNLLKIDIYRFGFMLGADIADDFPSRFGLDTASMTGSMPAFAFEKVYEFIKVKKIDSIMEGASNYDELYTVKSPLYHRGIKEQLVSSLQKGEALLSSVYLSRGVNLGMGDYMFLNSPMASVNLDFHSIVAGRTVLMRTEDDKMILQFSDLSGTKLELGAKLKFLFQKFPLLEYELKRLQRSDKVYELDDSEDTDLLVDNLSRTAPTDALQEHSVIERDIKLKQKTITSFLSIIDSWYKNLVSIEKSDADGTESELHIATEGKENSQRNMKGILNYAARDLLLNTYVLDNDNLLVKLNMSYVNQFATRNDFRWIYQTMLPLLGKNFILFNPEDVTYHLRKFSFAGEIYVTGAGVERAVANSRMDICLAYARAATKLVIQGVRYTPSKWCKIALGERNRMLGRGGRRNTKLENRLYSFLRNFRQVRESLRQPATSSEALLKRAEKVAKLFASNGFHAETWRTLLSLVGNKNLYRKAEVISAFGAFPGQESHIKLPKAMRGGADYGSLKEMERSMLQAVSIHTDPLLKELESFFYLDLGEGILPMGNNTAE